MNIRVNNDIGNPTVSHVTLHIKFDNVFLPVLHIPKPEIKHYALKPYKWLRFLGFILCGNTQPGFIAVSENEEPISEETIIGDELEHDDVYYIPSGMLQYLQVSNELCNGHLLVGQCRFIDPNSPPSEDSSDASTVSANSAITNFVRQRDQNRCVLSGWKSDTTIRVCHLIPRSKGDLVSYMIASNHFQLFLTYYSISNMSPVLRILRIPMDWMFK